MKDKAKFAGIIAIAALIGFSLVSCIDPLDDETVARPTASPKAGTYTSERTVKLSCTTEGASIHYTLDGSDPTADSDLYSTPITISATTTLKAIAVKEGMNDSRILTALYTINNSQLATVATPTASPAEGTYTSAQAVTLSCTTEEASIRYTLDGSTPTTGSDLYSAATPIPITATTTLKAIAMKNGMNNSGVLTAVYTINDPQLETAATPTANPAGGTYPSTQTVALSCTTDGASIHYTLNGSTPTATSALYSAAISISSTTTLKAIAVKEGMNNSSVLTAVYTIEVPLIPVTFSDVSANGSASVTTTQLTLTFSAAITGLSASDITLGGVTGVVKGTLTGSGPTYTLPISGFAAGGVLNVTVTKPGYTISGSPKTATIFFTTAGGEPPGPVTPIPPAIGVGGVLNPATTNTQLSNSSFTPIMPPHKGGNKVLSGSPYGYETWDDDGGDNTGIAKFIWYGANQGGGAAFRAEWGKSPETDAKDRPKDFLARVGYFWNTGNPHTYYKNIYCGFNFDKSGQYRGNFSYIGIYGWSKSPTVEYYIVENSYGNAWNDHAGYIARLNEDTLKGDEMESYTLDGSEYKVYKVSRTGPSINSDDESFTQFFSIRQTARTYGTISVTEHFKKWADRGMNLGSNMYECKFKVEVGGRATNGSASTEGYFDARLIQFYRAGNDGTIIQITP